jgi:hypothetical protein
VNYFVDIVREMAESAKYSFKVGPFLSVQNYSHLHPVQVATVKTEVPKTRVQSYFEKGEIVPCGGGPPQLTQEALDSTIKMVAQIGAEPYLKILQDHPDVDVIIGGRSYDPAPFAAFCMYHGMGSVDNYGPAWHMGKIMVRLHLP